MHARRRWVLRRSRGLVVLAVGLCLGCVAPVLSACQGSGADSAEQEALTAAIVEWRTAEQSMWLVPRDQVDGILAQATAWDEKRDAAEAQGRHPWVNIVDRASRPIKVDQTAWVASLQPYVDRLDRILAPRSPLRQAPDFRDPADWVDYYEQWMLNNPITRMGDDPDRLQLMETVEVRMHDMAVERRFDDGRVGVVAHLWEGGRYADGKRFGCYDEWQVLLSPYDGGWRVVDAQWTGNQGEYRPDGGSGPPSSSDWSFCCRQEGTLF